MLMIVIDVVLLSEQQQINTVLTKLTSKFQKTQNMKLLTQSLSFSEHLKLLNLDKKRERYDQYNSQILNSLSPSIILRAATKK